MGVSPLEGFDDYVTEALRDNPAPGLSISIVKEENGQADSPKDQVYVNDDQATLSNVLTYCGGSIVMKCLAKPASNDKVNSSY
jgi:hypothetical protein